MPLGVLLALMLPRWLNPKRRIPRQMASTCRFNTKQHVSTLLSIAGITLEQIHLRETPLHQPMAVPYPRNNRSI